MTWLAILALPALWTIFLAYTALRAHWRGLRPEVKAVGLLVVLAGWLLDVAINWTLGLALGVTKDATLSQKCGRLKRAGGWRGRCATYLCETWLDPFDQNHCH